MHKSLKNAFLRFAQQHKLFDQHKNILIALSGGVDSMTLLHLLLEWRRHLNLTVSAIHINHQLRGKESDKDQEFVKDVCRQKEIPIYIEKVELKEFARKKKYSIEEAGHILREEIYQKYLKDRNFDVVVTAHNLNDQAETILMHILEGTGLEGLAGIYLEKKGIVRSLLFATRSKIEKYAEEKNIPFRQDQSNKDLRFKRNKIRKELLPFLAREFSLNKLDSFLKMGLIVQEWSAYSEKLFKDIERKIIYDEKDNSASIRFSDYQKLFSGTQIKLIENILEQLIGVKTNLDYNTFHGFKNWLNTNKSGTKFQLHSQVLVYWKDEHLVFQNVSNLPIKIKLEIPSENVYNLPESGIQFILKEVKPDLVKFTENHSVEYIDKEKIDFPMVLRNWKTADRFQPLGSDFERLVSDFLTDLRIKFPQKKMVMILEHQGKIVAIPGYRISDKYKITEKTKRVLKIELRNKKYS